MLVLFSFISIAQEGSPHRALNKELGGGDKSISILWSSYNPNVFENSILPYFKYSCDTKCWKDVTLIMWGPAVKLLKENVNLQINLAELISKGMKVKACQLSVYKYNAKTELTNIGVDIRDIYGDLTKELQNNVGHLAVY